MTELTFLAAIRANPTDDVTRLVYADWLDERDEPDAHARAAFLRAECELNRLPADTPDRDRLIGQLRQLAEPLAGLWKAAVARMTLENCGVPWKFVCPKSWEQLQERDDHWVRSCSVCQREVYYCTSISEAKWRASTGACVAVDLRVRRQPGDLPESVEYVVTSGIMLSDEELLNPSDEDVSKE